MKQKRLIAIVGGIAVGKTTIGRILVENSNNVKLIEEDVSKNEFLKDFYDDMSRWAFHSRISTLAMIASNYIVENVNEDVIVMDRCLDELITFARLQFEKGNLSEREFKVYRQLYNDILSLAPKIDGYIFCFCDPKVSLERIKLRNRPFEQGINTEYLIQLNNQYEEWIKTLEASKVLCINTSEDIDIDKVMSFVLG